MTLDFPYRHAAGIQRQYLVVKAAPAGLVFSDELRLEAAGAVSGNLNGQDAKIALERLGADAVTGVAALVDNGFVLVVTQMSSHLGLQRPFDNGFGELFKNSVLPIKSSGF